MAAKKGETLDWKELKSSMADMKDLLRCWTCNKVFLDPVRYRCGHYFCGSCAEASGTKCGSCNIPSQKSDIQSDFIVSNIVENFQTLCKLINFEKEPSESSFPEDRKKSSRSTLYEDALPHNSTSSKGSLTIKTSSHTELARNNLETKLTKQSPNENTSIQSLRKRNVSEASLDLKSNQEQFKRPSRLRKRNDKDTDKAHPPKSKAKPSPSTMKDKSKNSCDEASIKKLAQVSKKQSSKHGSNVRLSSDDLQSKGTVQDPQDCFVTPSKPRRSVKSTNVSPISSTKRAESSMGKSTPQKNGTPGRELNKKNHKGETPLHVACIKGNVERVQTLLNANATPNTKDNAGWTPLHEAAAHGFHEVVKLLLEAGAMISVPGSTNNVTPLHEAVTNKHLSIVKLLVAHGADIYARSSEGKTPIEFALSEEMKDALLNTEKILKSPEADSLVVKAHMTQVDMVLCGESDLTSEEKSELSTVALQLGARWVPVFCSEVTHLVAASDDSVATCPPSMDVLCAILQGTFILTREWLNLLKDGVLNIDPEMFELAGVTDFDDAEAPKLSRENAEKQLPKLFNGCHFFVTNNVSYKMPKCSFTKANVIHLIKTGGGIVLTRHPDPEAIPAAEQTVPYHASRNGPLSHTSHFIIYSPGRGEPELKYNMKHCKTLSIEWLIHCILNWRLMDP